MRTKTDEAGSSRLYTSRTALCTKSSLQYGAKTNGATNWRNLVRVDYEFFRSNGQSLCLRAY